MKGFRQAVLAAALLGVTAFVPARAAGAQTLSRSSRIGVSVSEIEDAAKDAKSPKMGVSVDSVTPGGPADKAGIKAGDAITEFDGERVRSVRQFSRLVQETPSGRTVPVSVSRAGQHVAVSVTAERAEWGDDFAMRLLAVPRVARPAMPPEPPEAPRPPRVPTPPAALIAPFDSYRVLSTGHRLGVTLESLDDQLAQFFGVKDGVLVRSVAKDSTGQQAGLKAGDVITSVNGRQVYDVGDVTRALDRSGDSGEFTVEIVRDRKPQTVKGKF
jgi:serine protease Do